MGPGACVRAASLPRGPAAVIALALRTLFCMLSGILPPGAESLMQITQHQLRPNPGLESCRWAGGCCLLRACQCCLMPVSSLLHILPRPRDRASSLLRNRPVLHPGPNMYPLPPRVDAVRKSVSTLSICSLGICRPLHLSQSIPPFSPHSQPSILLKPRADMVISTAS